MKKNYTDITIVLDRSGSMESTKQDTIGGFNQFIADQKKLPGECTLTLVQFDTVYEFVHQGKPIAEVTDLVFEPRGMTALLDAIGRTIIALGSRLGSLPEDERPEAVLFVIMTDGGENSSHEFKRDQIREMIVHQTEVYKWKFVFIGANQDSFTESASLGISADSTMNYAPNQMGTRGVYETLSTNTASFRASAGAAPMVTEEDREKQKAAGA